MAKPAGVSRVGDSRAAVLRGAIAHIPRVGLELCHVGSARY